jgi:hypothetical protein
MRIVAALLFAFASQAAMCSGLGLVWARSQSVSSCIVRPTAAAIDHFSDNPQTYYVIATYSVPAAAGASYLWDINFWSRDATQNIRHGGGTTIPMALSLADWSEVYVANKYITANSGKISFDFNISNVGAVRYTYNPNTPSYDSPLALGDGAYYLLLAGNVQTPNGREFIVLEPPVNGVDGTPPTTLIADKSLSPSSAFFRSGKIYAVGNDNNPPAPRGGARATVYNISGTGPANYTVSQTFSVATHNTYDSATSTSTGYQHLWGVADSSHVYLVTNKTVAHAGSYQRSYTIELFDGSGNGIWTSASAPGLISEISVGGPNDIYVRGIMALVTRYLLRPITSMALAAGLKTFRAQTSPLL